MRTFAYCLASAAKSVRRMAGVEPALCPPITQESFRGGWLEYRDLIVFKLHGRHGEPYWMGDRGEIALLARNLEDVHLDGAVVFAENCWLPESPMLEALLDAGASAVVGGSGVNYGGTATMAGADLLGLYFRWALEHGGRPEGALLFAKLRLRLKWPSLAVRDTLAFQLYEQDVVAVGAGHAPPLQRR